MRRVRIGDRWLGDGEPPFIVGECGINHNGNLDTALAMVHVAKHCGCDAVKFATLKAAEFCNPDHVVTYRYQGQLIIESEMKMFQRAELPDDAWKAIKAECDAVGIVFFSTPQNESDLDILMGVGVPCIKVGSDDLTNLALLEAYARRGLPMILSTGMADTWDVRLALEVVKGVPVVVLACTSEYPCPPEHANVARVHTLRSLLGVTVGYSDHTVGNTAAAAATALGASYLEKHFTLNNAALGPDHEFSAGPLQLQAWVAAIRNTYRVMGSGKIEPTEQERINRENWRRQSGQQIRGERKETA